MAQFKPKFTYAIFGEDERIFGYQGLKINLQYNASDMRPNLQVSYGKKFTAIGETEPADIEATMHDFLPEGTACLSLSSSNDTDGNSVAFTSRTEFESSHASFGADWMPPGRLLRSFSTQDRQYEVWNGSLADPAVQQMINRIQILTLLLIEGGSLIGTDDSDSLDRWTVFFLYHKKGPADSKASPYSFMGYSTVYKFFPYQLPKLAESPATIENLELSKGDFTLSQLPCRSRISQFVILPPFQGRGLGSQLYSTIFKLYHEDPQTIEITVEDPNEAFDDLRDLSDLAFLRTVPEFQALKINTEVTLAKPGPVPKNIVNADAAEALRQKAKIAPRQFSRVLELNLMSKLHHSVRQMLEDPERVVPKEHEYEYKLWRLLVKQRLYRHNKEMLGQLELDERISKLDETLYGVEFDYARLWAKFERANGALGNGKRKPEEAAEGSSASKKPRVDGDAEMA